MNTPVTNQEHTPSNEVNDSAGLVFSGKVKIFDVETGEVLVEQRSE